MDTLYWVKIKAITINIIAAVIIIYITAEKTKVGVYKISSFSSPFFVSEIFLAPWYANFIFEKSSICFINITNCDFVRFVIKLATSS